MEGEADSQEVGFLPSQLKSSGRRLNPHTGRGPQRARRRKMKKQALKAVTMLFSIIVLAFMTALVSSAQSGGHNLKANIPFDFVVGDKTLAAGQYVVARITSDSDAEIVVRSRDSRQSAIRLSNKVEAPTAQRRALLTFHRYGSAYFLEQVWMPGSTEGREMLKSKAERAIERELAKNPSRNGWAENAQPETVTVYAELQ